MEENTEARVRVMPKKKKKKNRYLPMDAPFFMLVCTLLLFGLVMVYSASYAVSLRDNGVTDYYFKRQAMFGAAGFVIMVLIAKLFDYRWLKKCWLVILALSILALVAVLIFGTVRNYSKRWIIIAGITVQPSEFTKIGLIVFFAAYIEKYAAKMRTIRYGVGTYVAIMALVGVLLYKEPHISCAALIIITCLIMIFVGGIRWLHIIYGGILAIGGVGTTVYFASALGYIQRRFGAWLDPTADAKGTGYQILQSLYAVGSGGWFGLGLGNGRQKQLFLPESHNDYVFAILCEELGFVGAMLTILLFAAFIIRGFWIAFHAGDTFGRMLVVGIMSMISLQVILNIAVVTNTIPATGIALPFFSYGGTSLLVLMAEMGLVLSVSRQIPLKKEI